MNLVIEPEPSELERAAIVRALAETDRGRTVSEWWRRGVEEATGGQESDDSG
jgi:hypothetical protein